MRETESGVSYPTSRGGDAYVIRTSLLIFDIHIIF